MAEYIRLSVNLAPTVSEALRATAARKGLSITEAVRHAVAVWKFITDEQAKGNRVLIMEGEGTGARFREVVQP